MGDFTDDLIDGEKKCSMPMRIKAAMKIERLRSIIHTLAPDGSDAYQYVSNMLAKDEIEAIYFREHQLRREAAEANAIAWIGA